MSKRSRPCSASAAVASKPSAAPQLAEFNVDEVAPSYKRLQNGSDVRGIAIAGGQAAGILHRGALPCIVRPVLFRQGSYLVFCQCTGQGIIPNMPNYGLNNSWGVDTQQLVMHGQGLARSSAF